MNKTFGEQLKTQLTEFQEQEKLIKKKACEDKGRKCDDCEFAGCECHKEKEVK